MIFRRKIPNWVFTLLHVIIVLTPFIIVWYTHYEPLSLIAKSRKVSALILCAYLLCYYYLSAKLDGFRLSIRRIHELIFSHIISLTITNVFGFFLIWIVSIHCPNVLNLLFCTFLQMICASLLDYFFHQLYFATNPPQKTVVIYKDFHTMEDLIESYGLKKRFEVRAEYEYDDFFSEITDKAEETDCYAQLKAIHEKLKDFECIFLSKISKQDRDLFLKYSVSYNKRLFMIPDKTDLILSGAERIHMFHLPFTVVNRYCPPKEYQIVKRITDIAVSGLAMILLSPLLLIITLLVRSDGGPALYKQVRLTKDSRKFVMLKFRSMRVDAETESGAILSSGENDPRITKVGKILRRYRLDELPQLIHVFKGDMSLVGPRPERPEIAESYEKEEPDFSLRLQCKAGLTGYAQVYGKYNTEPHDKLLMDLMYISNPSVFEDLCIMLATVKVLFSKESTEGVAEQPVLMGQDQVNQRIKQRMKA